MYRYLLQSSYCREGLKPISGVHFPSMAWQLHVHYLLYHTSLHVYVYPMPCGTFGFLLNINNMFSVYEV